MINLFLKWLLFIYRKIWICKVFLIKLYFKATPYAEESETISQMHQYIKEQGYTFNGKHHEIYLSDPNRVAPEKLKTILRQPIKHV